MASEQTSSERVQLGILALLAADRAEREPEPALSTEVVLDAAGLSNQQIAAVLGKNPDAIRMKISRAKAAAKKKGKGARK